MSVTWSAFSQPALFTGDSRTTPMPFSMHSMCMTAAPDFMVIGTGVLASVSLFVLLHIVTALLLVSLVVLISLILSGLTGLGGLVGLTVGLETNTARGD